MIHQETRCRLCGHEDLHKILALGETPLADRLIAWNVPEGGDRLEPLTLMYCPHCSLVQIAETVNPEDLFENGYPYYSSVSPALQEHFRQSAQKIMEKIPLTTDSLVVEAASNDGYLLRHFLEKGIPTLGIDPAEGPAAVAAKLGIPVLYDYFSLNTAKKLVKKGKKADLFLANNVLAHVDDLNGFVEGMALLMKEDATAVIEVPYVCDLMEHLEFDTIYHQHLCYFSVSALDFLFRKHGLSLNHVDRTPIHGGSLRLWIQKEPQVDESVILLKNYEKSLQQLEYCKEFARKTEEIGVRLRTLIRNLKEQGKTIAAYGAAAKGTTLLSYTHLCRNELDFVADLNPHKQGFSLPGSRIPIVSPQELTTRHPDYVLILAWNFAEEIMAQQSDYLKTGGRFIIPVPEPRIVEVDS